MSSPATAAILIAEWPRGSRQTIRIRLDRFNDVDTVDVRSWWRNETGDPLPSKTGITLSLRHLPARAAGLNAAMVEATRRGLLPGETGKRQATERREP